MLHGIKIIDELKEGVAKFMTDKKFETVQEIVGKSIPYFSTHMDLVERMKQAKRHKGRRIQPRQRLGGKEHYREDGGTDIQLSKKQFR